jgi:hypothetical protein
VQPCPSTPATPPSECPEEGHHEHESKVPLAAALALLAAGQLVVAAAAPAAATLDRDIEPDRFRESEHRTRSVPSRSPSPFEKSVEGSVVCPPPRDRLSVSSWARGPGVSVFGWKLPMTLELNEFNGREQIGDVICFPWGNIGFCYSTYGIGCSDQTISLGTWHASEGTNSGASRDSRPGSGWRRSRTPVRCDAGVPAGTSIDRGSRSAFRPP